jgi:hypothetical protein
MSIPQLRSYFFDHCHGFSVMYEALASADGARFRKECADAGKLICAWTVNSKEEMRQCARWGIMSIISDKPAQWKDIKKEVSLSGLVEVLVKLMRDSGQPVNCVETNSCDVHLALCPYEELVFQLCQYIFTFSSSATLTSRNVWLWRKQNTWSEKLESSTVSWFQPRPCELPNPETRLDEVSHFCHRISQSRLCNEVLSI